MKIEFVYFDIGGVLVLDFSKTDKWNEMLDDLNVSEKDKPRLSTLFDKKEIDFCLGKEDVDSFITIMKDDFKLNLPKDYSFLADFANRFEPNPDLGKLVAKLKRRYKLGLLTNMYPKMLDLITKKNLLPKVNWDTIVDSSVVGFMKPQREIYEFATKQAGVLSNNILFVENSKVHIEEAKKLGWKTFLYDPSNIVGSNTALEEFLL
ncbi:HAD-IA family hydrolase [Patescibacteria group bacterium]|nr:HAD-IA family hydrolase [Patescibacteria group bacterium]